MGRESSVGLRAGTLGSITSAAVFFSWLRFFCARILVRHTHSSLPLSCWTPSAHGGGRVGGSTCLSIRREACERRRDRSVGYAGKSQPAFVRGHPHRYAISGGPEVYDRTEQRESPGPQRPPGLANALLPRRTTPRRYPGRNGAHEARRRHT